MEQKDDVDQGDNNGFLNQSVLERGHRPLDEARAIVERHDRHPTWEPGLNRPHFCLDLVDNVDGTDPIARHHNPTYGFGSTFDEGTSPEGIPDLHLSHLADEDGNAILSAHHDVLDVAEMLDEPQTTHHGPGTVRLYDVAADIAVAPHHGIYHGGQRQAEGAQ